MDEEGRVPATWALLLREMSAAGDADAAWEQFAHFVEMHHRGDIDGIHVAGMPREVHRAWVAMATAYLHLSVDWAPGLVEPWAHVAASLDKIRLFVSDQASDPAFASRLGQLILPVRFEVRGTLATIAHMVSFLYPLPLQPPQRDALAPLVDELREAARLFDAAAGETVIGPIPAFPAET